MIKVVFLDIDGTLLSHANKCVPESTIKALYKLKEKGIKIVAASGRHTSELDRLPLQEVPFDHMILLNGQICIDASRKQLFSYPIKDTEKLKKVFDEKRIPIEFFEEKDFYINIVDDYAKKALNDISTPIPRIDTYKNEPILQAVAYGPKQMQEELKKILTECHITNWHEEAVDIVNKGNNKAVGIKKYCEIMGIKQEETMAFGDNGNDIEMLKYVHIGVAMGNGTKEAKEAADYITDHIDEDGLAKAIEYFEDIFS
ncbi:MAG: HAD family hydrolase [Erysipelotrichaceae bacterium]|nr:HAD family hydrolase [Erysipelotrichaceae bacterium]